MFSTINSLEYYSYVSTNFQASVLQNRTLNKTRLCDYHLYSSHAKIKFLTERTMSKEHVIGVIRHVNIIRSNVMKLSELFLYTCAYVIIIYAL